MKHEVIQADHDLWERLRSAILQGGITGPEAVASIRIETERRIVEWLRKEADDLAEQQGKLEAWRSPEWLALREQIESAHEHADAIEAGAHRDD